VSRYGERFRLVKLDSYIKLVRVPTTHWRSCERQLPTVFARRRSPILKEQLLMRAANRRMICDVFGISATDSEYSGA
jgi:hypothetical protein